jgi:hypothetical protein
LVYRLGVADGVLALGAVGTHQQYTVVKLHIGPPS